MIKKVEEKVGSPLFDRSASPVRLTETGRAYLRAAEQIQEAEDGFCHYLSDAEACLTGSLSLGGTTLLTSYVLAPLISAFSARFPRVMLCVMTKRISGPGIRVSNTAALKNPTKFMGESQYMGTEKAANPPRSRSVITNCLRFRPGSCARLSANGRGRRCPAPPCGRRDARGHWTGGRGRASRFGRCRP